MTILAKLMLSVSVAAATLLAAAALGPAAAPRSGLYGIVMKGPVRPVCAENEPCDVPVQATLVFSRHGKESARTRSSKEGRFRIALAPGIYAVRTVERIGIDRNIRPRNVKVRRAHWDRLVFHIDTGIR